LLALAVAPAASVHAGLETTEPADDAVVEEASAQVSLRSKEPEEGRARMIRLALLVTVLTFVACPAAAAHSGGGAVGARGYVSTLVAVQPPRMGILVEILDGDDRLALTNSTGGMLVVFGYEGEPYLRFTPDGVYRNSRSPATYLNEDRYAQVELPPWASPAEDPLWEQVAGGERWEWHDHRIHWMSTLPPSVVRSAPDTSHHIFNWEVPAELDGDPLTILGSLDYTRPSGGWGRLVWVALIGGLLVAAFAWLVLKRRAGGRR